jgi:hypothetical protein
LARAPDRQRLASAASLSLASARAAIHFALGTPPILPPSFLTATTCAQVPLNLGSCSSARCPAWPRMPSPFRLPFPAKLSACARPPLARQAEPPPCPLPLRKSAGRGPPGRKPGNDLGAEFAKAIWPDRSATARPTSPRSKKTPGVQTTHGRHWNCKAQ